MADQSKFNLRRIALVLTGLSLLVGGCALNESPLEPHASLSVSQFTGTPLSGPTTRIADVSDPATAIFIDAQVYAVGILKSADLQPVVSDARLIVLSATGRPLSATARLTRGFAWGISPAADRIENELASGGFGQDVEIGRVALAVSPGATAVLAVTSDQAATQVGIPAGVRILLHCPAAGQLEPAVAAAGLIQETARGEDQSDQPEVREVLQPISTGELAILPPVSLHSPAKLALATPFEFSDPRLHGLLVILSASRARAGDAQLAAALAKSAADLADSAKFAADSAQTSFTDLTYWSALQVAIQGLADPGRRRACLSFLSVRTNASICEDFALVADDQLLGRLADALQPKLTQAAAMGSNAAAQWAMDVAALNLMDKLQTDGKLPPELLSVLARNVGEPAMNPGSADEIVAASHDSQDFRVRLIAENFNYLEDNSPAARVRAFDWLSEHGAAPAGFDPLASHQDRQAALEKAYDALVQPGGTNP